MKQFPKIYSPNREVSQIQDAIVDAIDPLLALPLSDSNFLENVDLTTGSNIVSHGLGRDLRGWIVVRKDADESIYDTQDSNSLPALTLMLVSSGAVTVSLIVF